MVSVPLLYCYSYCSDVTPYYGTTNNAADNKLQWVMKNVIPDATGLEINAVQYSYIIQKDTDDLVLVHVQNENANGSGYIFRETDEWRPGSLGGTGINKTVPVVPGIPSSSWGKGSIDVEGNGSVTDTNVKYSYKVDPCYDPQSNPGCPGYERIMPETPQVDLSTIYDATEDYDQTQYEEEKFYDEDGNEISEEEKEKREKEDKKDSKERLEKALAAADNSALFAEALASAAALESITMAQNMNSYYRADIPGGSYNDNIVLVDKQLPENKNGLRNGLAQQILHDKMIEQQYNLLRK